MHGPSTTLTVSFATRTYRSPKPTLPARRFRCSLMRQSSTPRSTPRTSVPVATRTLRTCRTPKRTSPSAAANATGIEADIYLKSDHGQAIHKGVAEAASCQDCHGNAHELLDYRNPASPVNRAHIPETCGRCHGNVEAMEKFNLRQRAVVVTYENSVHGLGALQRRLPTPLSAPTAMGRTISIGPQTRNRSCTGRTFPRHAGSATKMWRRPTSVAFTVRRSRAACVTRPSAPIATASTRFRR